MLRNDLFEFLIHFRRMGIFTVNVCKENNNSLVHYYFLCCNLNRFKLQHSLKNIRKIKDSILCILMSEMHQASSVFKKNKILNYNKKQVYICNTNHSILKLISTYFEFRKDLVASIFFILVWEKNSLTLT